jgi:hypothetical protein
VAAADETPTPVFAQSAAAMRLARKVNGCSSSNCSEKSGGQVPAFTIRSWSLSNHQQSGIRVEEPPRINVFAERPTPSLAFRRIYDRGDLPVCIVHESRLYRLGWKVLSARNPQFCHLKHSQFYEDNAISQTIYSQVN